MSESDSVEPRATEVDTLVRLGEESIAQPRTDEALAVWPNDIFILRSQFRNRLPASCSSTMGWPPGHSGNAASVLVGEEAGMMRFCGVLKLWAEITYTALIPPLI